MFDISIAGFRGIVIKKKMARRDNWGVLS